MENSYRVKFYIKEKACGAKKILSCQLKLSKKSLEKRNEDE